MALTQQQLEQLRRAGYLGADGKLYMSTGASGAGMAQEDGTGAGAYNPADPMSGYFGGYQEYDASGLGDVSKMMDDSALKGRTFGAYGADGKFLGEGTNTWGGLDPMVKIAPYIMAALATMGVGSTIAGVGAAAGAGAGGAAGAAGAMGPMTAAETAAANAGLTSSLAPYAAAPAAASSLLSGAKGLLNSNLLGPAVAAVGGLLGSKSKDDAATQEKKLPDYLQGPVANDLIPRAQGLLAKQMTPEMMAGYGQMRNVGMGLLGQAPATNGFSRFYK